MGCMSASDAAPLPRLGEVFFDVRGSSRSMRLSWYADTGVAVFSIWQGGMCTGTFRLAIGDLPRMIETLERGPGGQPSGRDPAPTEAFGDAPMDAAARVRGLDPLRGDELPEYQTELMGHGPGSPAGYQAEQRDYGTGAAEYLTDRPDHLTGSSPYPTRASDYPAEAAGHRARPGEYPAEPPGQWPGSRDYLAGPADHPADAPDHRTEYLAERPGPGHEASGQRNGRPAGAGPPDYADPSQGSPSPFTGPRSGAPYPGAPSDAPYPGAPSDASYPPGRPDVSYPGGRSDSSYAGAPSDASYPGGRPDVSYLGRRSEAPYPGRPDASYPGAVPRAPYPDRSDPFYPGASTGGPHSRGTDGPVGPADDPYLGGTGPTDFLAEPPPAHYPPPQAEAAPITRRITALPIAMTSRRVRPPSRSRTAGRRAIEAPGPGTPTLTLRSTDPGPVSLQLGNPKMS